MSATTEIIYLPLGGARDLFYCKAPEVLLSGPAGTGKSRACLEKLHLCLLKYAGARALMVRKTLESLKTSGLVTYADKIRPEIDGVTFFGGNTREPAQFRYPNGSRLMLGGMDKPKKVMSTEYDIIYPQEATELTEEDWESLTTRLRNGIMPYQQLIADCNPDAPYHWLKQRCDRGLCVMLESRHEDNPTVTPEYLARLDNLTGVRKARLRDGIWAAAEGMVYEEWDTRIHLIDAPPAHPHGTLAGVDWGFTNPGVIGVWQWDGDGRLYMVREYYRTHETIDYWLDRAKEIRNEFHPEVFVCDPSEPGYIKQFRDAGLNAIGAVNDIRVGVDAVQQRLRTGADGRPRLFIVRDGLRDRDETLVAARQPLSTVQEFDSYVWPKNLAGKPVKEEPVDAYNHGLDQLRYVVMHRDLPDGGKPFGWLTDDPAFQAAHTPKVETEEQRVARRLAEYIAQQG